LPLLFSETEQGSERPGTLAQRNADQQITPGFDRETGHAHQRGQLRVMPMAVNQRMEGDLAPRNMTLFGW